MDQRLSYELFSLLLLGELPEPNRRSTARGQPVQAKGRTGKDKLGIQ